MTASFVPGATLNAGFYREIVRPLLGDLPHAAGLLGWGSDVLGYDTARSTDHGWGPRLLVLCDAGADVGATAAVLDERLPDSYAGWPVRYGWDDVAARHWVEVRTLPDWLEEQIGVDVSGGVSTRDWLVVPQQRLLGVTAGAVYADGSGLLTAVRERLGWYPDQVWRWLLAAQWRRLAQEEAFVARTAEVGDELGSAVVASRQARDLMRLALLYARRYAPYPKWLGTAFARLPHADDLPAHLLSAVTASDAEQRQEALAAAYVAVAGRHDRAGLTAPLPATITDYYSRPAQVLMCERYAEALLATVHDPELTGLPLLGGIDSVSDNSDLLSDPALVRRSFDLRGTQPA